MRHEGSATIERATSAGHGDAVWPVAALYGALSAAAAALGAWLAAWGFGLVRPWSILDWVAEHALWGTLLGALLALVVRLGARLDPSLREAGRRRAACARLAAICVPAALVALIALLAGARPASWEHAALTLLGAGIALLVAWALLGKGLAGRARFGALPRLDPARVAALIALITLPLAQGVRHAPVGSAENGGSPALGGSQASLLGHGSHALTPDSVVDAWRVMLGR